MSNDIKDNVQHIVDTIENGYKSEGPDYYDGQYEEGDIISGFDYLTDALDIEYIVSSTKEYLGARVLVSFGGPNIWINTRTKQVEGYWWGDSCIMPYGNDEMDIDGALRELYNCC